MKHFRFLICLIVYTFLSVCLPAEELIVTDGLLSLSVNDYDGGFILYGRHDETSDWTPLLWDDKSPSSYVRIWLDDSRIQWESPKNNARHFSYKTDTSVTLMRNDEYADIHLNYDLVKSDYAKTADSLFITVSIRPHNPVRKDKMEHYISSKDTHDGYLRICYDTYLGERNGRHFTYFTQNVVNPVITDLSSDISSDTVKNDDTHVRSSKNEVSLIQRIFGRQRPKRDFTEPPGMKVIDSECGFTKYAVPYIISSERPDSVALHISIKGDGLTTPSRIFFANWKAADTDGRYRIRDGAGFGAFPYGRDDSAAFLEYNIPLVNDVTADITAAVSITPNAVFLNRELNIQPEQSDDTVTVDMTTDSEMDRLLGGINMQLNSRKDVQQSGVDRTERMLNKIKNN